MQAGFLLVVNLTKRREVMTTTAERFSQTSLHLDKKRVGRPDAWKAMVGNKPVSARFALLPEEKPHIGAMGTSLILQISLAAFLVMLPLIFPHELIPNAMMMVTQIEDPPSYYVSTPPPPKPPAVARIKTKVEPPRPVEEPTPPPKPVFAKLPTARIFAPKIQRQQVVEAEAPKVDQVFQPVKLEIADTKQPARPREPVKTGLITPTPTPGSSAPATVSAPVEKVQTGGFGDPNGIAGPSNPTKRANAVNLGSALLPAGAAYGNGTGGANGVRGTVASTGFGNGVANPPSIKARAGSVQGAGFANQNDLVIDTPKKRADNTASVESVVIISKPNPVYSAEALKLNLEGEVLLDVVFLASGNQVQVNRVVKGLGHGLDEAAERAAQQIKFKPAMSAGHPVDFPAVIHIVFQIAY